MEVRPLSRKVGFSLADFSQVAFCSTKKNVGEMAGGGGGGSEGALPQMFCFSDHINVVVKFTNNFQSMYHKGLYLFYQ